MRKFLLCLLLICTFCLTSCHSEIIHWEFLYGYEDFAQIKIIELYGLFYDDEYSCTPDCYVLQEIDISRAEEVYNDILQLDMRGGVSHPPSTALGCGFLIVYKSGEYDTILNGGCQKYRHWKGETAISLLTYRAWCVSEDHLENLISKYVESDNMDSILK